MCIFFWQLIPKHFWGYMYLFLLRQHMPNFTIWWAIALLFFKNELSAMCLTSPELLAAPLFFHLVWTFIGWRAFRNTVLWHCARPQVLGICSKHRHCLQNTGSDHPRGAAPASRWKRRWEHQLWGPIPRFIMSVPLPIPICLQWRAGPPELAQRAESSRAADPMIWQLCRSTRRSYRTHIHTYTHVQRTCCRVKQELVQVLGASDSKLFQVLRQNWSKMFLLVFSNCIVFLGIFEITNSVEGCGTNFLQVVGVSSKGFSNKKECIFCCFYAGESIKRKDETWKRIISKRSQKIVCLGNFEQMFFAKMAFLETLQNTMSFRKVKERAFSPTLSVFGRCHFFVLPYKSPNTTKIGVSAGTGENPKWHFWFERCHFGRGLEKGFYYLSYTKAVLCWKHYFIVFSAKHSFAKKKKNGCGCKLKKQKFTKTWGLFANMQKGVFLCIWFSWWLCFFHFVFWRGENHKGLFPSILVAFLFRYPKGLSLKSFSSSNSDFFLFSFCLPFQKSIFLLAFCPSTSFWKTVTLGGLFCLSFCLLLC